MHARVLAAGVILTRRHSTVKSAIPQKRVSCQNWVFRANSNDIARLNNNLLSNG